MAIRQKTTSPKVKKETTLDIKSPQKLRHQWTDEDARRIKKMREEDKLSWSLCLLRSQAKSREISNHFPNHNAKVLANAYSYRLKGLCDTFTEHEVASY
jgi:hypothetical protein